MDLQKLNLEKIEYKLANGFNQFNITNENNLILGVVAGFSNDENLKHATLFENSPKLLIALQEMIYFAEFHGHTSSTEINNARKVLEETLS
ncbi:hypothetical protein [Flavobacterium psychrophilum]|uniref:hypothetical protein n=1 Tax=Flavobacterium psychrophilum TaxID=96345 RepID=UPI000A3D5535|nr:hypothetical protein [Flavobacterium psychrophilum]OUD27725.1 hypothetical protein FPG92_06965 [Flavobacterium psychrophilum]